METKFLKYIFLFFIISSLNSCGNKTSEKEAGIQENQIEDAYIEVSKAQFNSSNMALGGITNQTFSQGINTNGMVDVPPENKAQVSAVMGGYVKRTHLLVGDKVRKGELLLTLENPEFIEIQQNYLETHERLNFLKNEYDRQKTLFDEKITSQKNFLKAESDYKSALALYNGLERKLRMLNINPNNVKAGKFTASIPVYAPINGNITKVNVSVGQFMSASEPLMEIVNHNHKHIELVVFEKDVLKIKKGQKIHFKIPESFDNIYEAEVHLVGQSIDEENRTVRVHGHLEDESAPLLVGMFVEAQIIIDSVEKPALPISAILEEDSKFFVLVLKEEGENNYNFEKQEVTIGLKNENWTEILNPEEILDKKIVTKGAFLPAE